MVKAEGTSLDLKADKVVLKGDEASKNTAPIIDGATFANHHQGATQAKEVIPESKESGSESPTWLIAAAVVLILLIVVASLYWRSKHGSEAGTSSKAN